MLLLTSPTVLEFIVVFPIVCHHIFFKKTQGHKIKDTGKDKASTCKSTFVYLFLYVTVMCHGKF
jgi:hypothetical protein